MSGFRAVLLSVLLLLCAGARSASAAETRVAYVSGDLIYLEAGRDAGLAIGDTVEVFGEHGPIARLTVLHLSSKHASCARTAGDAEIAPGSRVQYSPGEPRLAPEAAESSTSATIAEPVSVRSRGWFRDHGLRGRVGLRFLALQQTKGGGGFTQPTIDLRLDGANVSGSGIDLAVDMRSRRTFTSGSPADEGRTRVHRLNGTWRRPGSAYVVTVGRQAPTTLSAIGLMDGVTAERRGARWAFGLITGSQPDAENQRWSSEVWEHGLYTRWSVWNASQRSLAASFGLVGSYRNGQTQREFASTQALWRSPRFSVQLAQETDIARSGPTSTDAPALSVANLLLHVRWRPRELVGLSAGFDSRRRLRSLLEAEGPEVEIDERHRQGGWLGLEVSPFQGVELDLETRGTTRGPDASHASTASVRVTRLPVKRAYLRTRITRYENERTTGWLRSVSVDLTPHPRLHLAVQTGVQDEKSQDPAFVGGDRRWLGLDADASLTRHWFGLLSLEAESRRRERGNQLYSSLSYRF